MNRSNVLEIKKTLQMKAGDMPSVDRICTCFVNGNKEKLISNTEKFFELDEEEQFKYTDILKGVLTGVIGKKLINLEYTSSKESEKAESMMRNAYTETFKGDKARDEFFDTIINNLAFDENYLIVAGHCIYDAPIKAADGKNLEDETITYEFMVTAICPVHSTKAGLTLDAKSGRMVSSKQIQIVEAPVNGFLYPAFNERETDIHGMLYFAKKPEEQHSELIEALIGEAAPTSSATQQNIFETLLAEVTDDSADFELVKQLHENLTTMADDAKQHSEDKKLRMEDIRNILEDAGVDKEKLEDFEHIYERAGGNDKTVFVPQNLIALDKFKIKAPDVEIKIKPDKTGLVQKRKIDGKNCIVVTIEGDVELNGIQVSEG